jgi:hypothetical protein
MPATPLDATAAEFAALYPTDEVTGISLPMPPALAPWPEMVGVCGQIARWSARQLIGCGYWEETAAAKVLAGYHQQLDRCQPEQPPPDFLKFLADEVHQHQPPTLAGTEPREELSRVQRALHPLVFERQPRWRFGDLPGRLWAQGISDPGRTRVMSLLRCASLASEDGCTVHMVACNPVAARLAATWLAIDAHNQTEGDGAPFIFPFVVDYEVWRRLHERQFPGVEA